VGSAYVLLGGDAGREQWRNSYREANNSGQFTDDELRAILLKASHHGSRHSSATDIWERFLRKNGVVVISASNEGNCYNHPHPETLDQLWTLRKNGYSLEVFCSNAPSLCAKLEYRPNDQGLDRIAERRLLTTAIPGHEVMLPSDTGGYECGFGTMTFKIQAEPHPNATLVDCEMNYQRCGYIRSTIGPGGTSLIP